MGNWSIFLTLLGSLALVPQDATQSRQASPTSQPANAQSDATRRKPREVEVLQKLLEPESRQEPILPVRPETQALRGVGELKPPDRDHSGLLIEGQILPDRPGRLLITGEKAEFAFYADVQGGEMRTMEINKSQLLEAMERDFAEGNEEFVITAQVTRYHDKNYLNLLKVLRRVPNGNLAP